MISLPDYDDINQEAAIAAWKAESTYNGSCPLSAWKAMKARYAKIDYKRWWRGDRKALRFVDLSPEMATTEAEIIVEPGLMRAIAKLPKDGRQIIDLKYWQGYTTVEAAEIMKRSPKSVETLLGRVHRQLRERMLDVKPRSVLPYR